MADGTRQWRLVENQFADAVREPRGSGKGHLRAVGMAKHKQWLVYCLDQRSNVRGLILDGVAFGGVAFGCLGFAAAPAAAA